MQLDFVGKILQPFVHCPPGNGSCDQDSYGDQPQIIPGQQPYHADDRSAQIEASIWRDTEGLVPSFQNKLEGRQLNKAEMEFSIDTFRVERFMAKWIRLDYSDAGMSAGTYAGAKLFLCRPAKGLQGRQNFVCLFLFSSNSFFIIVRYCSIFFFFTFQTTFYEAQH